MRLDVYRRCVNNGSRDSYINLIQSLIDEYYSYAVKLGYIDFSNRDKFNKYINGVTIRLDNSIGGDAVVNGNVITINPRRTFRTDIDLSSSEKNATEIIFHELSHVMNSFHDDYLEGENGLFDIFSEKFHSLGRTKFGLDITRNSDERDSYNLDKYPIYAIRLLDEAVAQNVCEDLMACKYNYDRNKRFESKLFLGINYRTNYNCYGIFQEIVERFSQTLAGINSFRDLCKLSFKEDAPYKIISEHIEKPYSFVCLYRELCLMGLILYAQYVREGHCKSSAIMPDVRFVQDEYVSLLDLLSKGYEYREVIDTPKVYVDKDNKTIRW